MSKPADAHPMMCFRIKLWAELFLSSLTLVRREKLSGDEIDRLLYTAMGHQLRRDRPRTMESLRAGRDLRRNIRRFTVEDCVRAGTRILGDDRLEKMYFSNIWLLVIPDHRPISFVTDAIQRVLNPLNLCRLSAEASVKLVRGLPELPDGYYPPEERFVARARHLLIPLLQLWCERQLICREDLTIALALMHQEAWLACQTTIADEIHAHVESHTRSMVSDFFSNCPNALQKHDRRFRSSMFYPDGKLEASPNELLRAARFVSGLVVPVRVEKDREELRKGRVHDIWYALHPSEVRHTWSTGSG